MWIYGGSLTAGSNQFNEYGSIRWMDHGIVKLIWMIQMDGSRLV